MQISWLANPLICELIINTSDKGLGEKPFSYVHYYANLNYLQSMGLIALISTKVACTYANRLVLTFDESVLEPILRLRFGSLCGQ